ncbi:MAG TPA: PQQ-dependent sugar dehydrogenase [Phycisphaerales bacterium]|nr:PQQ-dependent sugar dehydrogenase [Phycisphaerales bacterium]
MKHHTATIVCLTLLAGPAGAQPADAGRSTQPVAPPKPDVASSAPRMYTAADGTKYTVETVASKLEVPWAMAFAPDGRCFVTEKKGRVRIIDADGKLIEKPAFTVASVDATGGERGLMGICLHPDFATNHFVYLAYGDKAAKDIRVVRFKESEGTLTQDKEIVTGIETGGNHAGCGIKFGPDKKLYISTGEHFSRDIAQKMDNLNGKFLRVNDDGSVPNDNPWAGANAREGVRGEIWTIGNRNPQGFDWHPGTGMLYATEHGPSGEPVNGGKPAGGADEFNLIEKGKNYGWPAIYGDAKQEGMVSPLKQWSPANAPCGGAFVTSDKMFAGWVGNYMAAGLGGLQRERVPGVYMVKLSEDGRSVASIDRLVPDMGRIRAVAQAPDGSIWFSTSNKDGRARGMGDSAKDDQICRIVPVK